MALCTLHSHSFVCGWNIVIKFTYLTDIYLAINWWKIQQNMPGGFLEIPVYHFSFFTCVSHAEARNSYRLDVRPSVCPSVTRWYCIKMAEHIAMLSSPRDSPFILVLCLSRSSRNSDGVTPCLAAKQRWVWKCRNFRPILATDISLYLRNGWR